jgi:hypothetical protein
MAPSESDCRGGPNSPKTTQFNRRDCLRRTTATLLRTGNAAVTVMEIRQIKYFLAVCEERSFTRAARRCRVAQPSLTESIQKLESELGHALFHRGHRNTEISEFGLSLRPRFLAVVKAIEEARELAASFAMRKPRQNDDDNLHDR